MKAVRTHVKITQGDSLRGVGPLVHASVWTERFNAGGNIIGGRQNVLTKSSPLPRAHELQPIQDGGPQMMDTQISWLDGRGIEKRVTVGMEQYRRGRGQDFRGFIEEDTYVDIIDDGQ